MVLDSCSENLSRILTREEKNSNPVQSPVLCFVFPDQDVSFDDNHSNLIMLIEHCTSDII